MNVPDVFSFLATDRLQFSCARVHTGFSGRMKIEFLASLLCLCIFRRWLQQNMRVRCGLFAIPTFLISTSIAKRRDGNARVDDNAIQAMEKQN